MSGTFATGGHVYILARRMAGTLYVGVTSDLVKRVSEHRAGIASKFTAQHQVHRLVWYRHLGTIAEAIKFETQLKGWRREWKIKLIEDMNPKWDDLFPGLLGESGEPVFNP